MSEKIIELDLKKDIMGWDFFNWSKSLDFFDNNIDYKNIKNVLELGANDQSSGYSLFFAKKGISTTCSSYLKTSNELIKRHEKYKLIKNIIYDSQDAQKITYIEKFDIICFKSMLGGICKNGNYDNAKNVFNQIYKALKPGGYLAFSENINATFLHKHFRRKYISKSWYYFSQNELLNLMNSDFHYINSETVGFLGCFGRTELQKETISRLDENIFKNIIPKSWNYIYFGICQKPF